MSHIQVLVGRVALIFNFVMTIGLNTWKTGLQESLFRPELKTKTPCSDKGTHDSADTLLYKALIQGACQIRALGLVVMSRTNMLELYINSTLIFIY